jgi:plasmid maintenance system antidote protein VapI
MIARRLSPTQWARAAGVPQGEILAFLTGRSRGLAPATREKLAHAIGCTPDEVPR